MLGNASESPHVSFPTAPARARLHRCCFHLTSTWVFGCHGCCFSLAEGINTPMVCDHSIYIVALLLGKRRGEWEEHVPTRRRGSVLLRLQGGGRTRASAGGLLGVSPLPPMPCGMTSGGPSIVSPLSLWLAGRAERVATMGCVSSSSNQKVPAQRVIEAKKLVQLFEQCYSAGEPR